MEWWLNGSYLISSSFPLILLRLLSLPRRLWDSWPSPWSGTWMCWFSSQLLHARMWTSLVRVDGSWPGEANRAMSSAKCKDLILDSLNRNSVHQGYEQKLCQREALVESKPHYKWIRLTAGNADQALTPGVQGPDSLNTGICPPMLPPPPTGIPDMVKCFPQVYRADADWLEKLPRLLQDHAEAWSNRKLFSPPKSQVYLFSWPSSAQPLKRQDQGGWNILSGPPSQNQGHSVLVWPLVFLFFYWPHIVNFQWFISRLLAHLCLLDDHAWAPMGLSDCQRMNQNFLIFHGCKRHHETNSGEGRIVSSWEQGHHNNF